jgi:hypothetical protein
VVAEFAPRPRTWILAPGPAEAYAPAPANESMFADGDDGE